MKVLIVDGVWILRRRLQQILTNRGYSVAAVPCGLSALECLKDDDEIRVVLSDLYLPRLNGLELFQAAREIKWPEGQGRQWPPAFILMTAFRCGGAAEIDKARELMKHALDLGFIDIVTKPLDFNRVIGLLEAVESGIPERLQGPIRGPNSPTALLPADQVLKSLRQTVEELIQEERVDELTRLNEDIVAIRSELVEAISTLTAEPVSEVSRPEPPAPSDANIPCQ